MQFSNICIITFVSNYIQNFIKIYLISISNIIFTCQIDLLIQSCFVHSSFALHSFTSFTHLSLTHRSLNMIMN